MASRSVAAVLLSALVCSISKVSSLPIAEDTAMLQMMDAMQQLMTGEPTFDRVYYQELRDCMDTFHPDLTASQDGAWQGLIDYWISRGAPDDPWGGFMTVYIEQNATNADFLNMTFYEPCNTASNLAYYHDVTEFCSRKAVGTPFILPEKYVNGLGMAYSALVMGSSFMHLSHTNLGGQQDTRGVSLISYITHQACLSALPGASSVLTDLKNTSRAQTALELNEEFLKMYLTMPVTEWRDHTDSLDLPDYYLTFAGIFSTVLTIGFKPEVVDKYVPILAAAFGLDEAIVSFITDQYLPELRSLTANLDLGLVGKKRFLQNAISTVEKLIYAFLWQEEVLTDNPVFLNETVNGWGWEKLPEVNARANGINSFEYFEKEFQNGTDIYPGDTWCNPVIPHAKWHLESSIGLLDLVYLGEYMFNLFSEIETSSVR